MFKKSCITVCLLASAACATEFDDKWQGSFTVASKKGQLQVERTSKGIVLTENGKKGESQPTLSLTNIKGDDIKLKSILTPRSFEKALSQAGEVIRIFPPALDEYIQASKTEEQRFIEACHKKCGGILSREEISKMWTGFMEMVSQEPVVQSLHVERVIAENTGESRDYNVTQETAWLQTLGPKFPNLDVDIFKRWYSSQNKGTSQGINDEALTRYIDMGAALYNHNPSLVPQDFNGEVQIFKTDVAEMMKLRLQPGFQMSPLQDGQIDTLTLLDYSNRRTAVFSTVKVVAEVSKVVS